MGQFPTPRTPGIPLAVDAALPPAPRIGEHGAAILSEIGIDPTTIARLRAENVLLTPKGNHDRQFRPASAPFSRTPLFRGSRGRGALLHPEPDGDRGAFCRLPDPLGG